MIGIDTNVLLRILLDDDPEQVAIIRTFLAERSAQSPAFVSLLVVAEAVWVLRRRYQIDIARICDGFSALLLAEKMVFEDEDFLGALFAHHPPASDTADHIVAHVARKAGCVTTVTFDRAAVRHVSGMELLT